MPFKAHTLDQFRYTVGVTRTRTAAVQASRRTMLERREAANALLTSVQTSLEHLMLRCEEVITDVTLPKPNGAGSVVERDLWRSHVAYAVRRDPHALDRLVTTYLPRAERQARLGTRRPGDLDDRLQVAREALLLALQRFDPKRKLPFGAFADVTINGELQKHIRDHGWIVRAPRRVHELMPPIRASTERLTQLLDRTPTPLEVAADLQVSEDDVLMAMNAHHARAHQSLDALICDDTTTYDINGTNDNRFALVDDRDALRRALERLTEDDRRVVHDYFVERMTQQEIAERLGMSQMHVSRRLRRILRVLAARLASEN